MTLGVVLYKACDLGASAMVGPEGLQRTCICTRAKRGRITWARLTNTAKGRLDPQDPHSKDADERAVGAVPLMLIKGRPVDAIHAFRAALELRARIDG